MRGEQALLNLEIKKKTGLSINPDIHHSKVFSSGLVISKDFIHLFLDPKQHPPPFYPDLYPLKKGNNIPNCM